MHYSDKPQSDDLLANASLSDDQLIAINTLRSISLDRIYQIAADPELLRSDAWNQFKGRSQVEQALDKAASLAKQQRVGADRAKAVILTWNDRGYPPIFFDLELPPPVLYVRGSLPPTCLQNPTLAIAIVGSRRCGDYGRQAAKRFGRRLASAGATVVSGMATGVDGAAHRGALETSGKTVAVLGCGIDVAYPRHHRSLADQIAGQGAVISQFPIATPPLARNFPIRNHLISALARSVLVVRATFRSGSLITARLALDLGRDVFAVPGSIFDVRSQGCHALISDGAGVAHRPRDLIDFIPGLQLPEDASSAIPKEVDRKLWEALPPLGESISVEQLSKALERRIEELLVELSKLELLGLISRQPGDRFGRLVR